MKYFVTGASGWIGSAVTIELLEAGHDVVGLARSDESAARIGAAGAAVLRGSLDDLESLKAGAAASDGVVHLGFNHDFANYAAAGLTERAAVTALATTLAGSDRPLLLAAGVAGLSQGRPATELDSSPFTTHDSPRGASEHLALGFVDQGVRVISARFAPTVHGEGDHGFTATLAGVAKSTGSASYVGDGTNRWSAVHRTDAARVVRLGLEKAPAGSVLHAVGEEGIETRAIAEAIGAGLDLPITSISPEDAPAHFGWIGRFFGMDASASSLLTQELLGWTPTGPTLREDLEAGYYWG